MREVEINGLKCNISNEVLEYPSEGYSIISGGLNAMLWDEYFELFKEHTKPYIQLIRKFIELNDLTKTCADEFCNDNTFVFSDGIKIGFSWRGWGDLVSSINGKKEGYVNYYMKN